MNFRKTVARHPGVTWVLVAIEVAVIDLLIILGITPAWAAVVIPVTDTVTINLGELPQWIIALVAAGGLWKAWRVEQRTMELGVKIDGMLVDRDAAKVKEGEATATVAAGVAADQLQKGVEQGIAQERASVAAANPAPAVAVSGVVPGEAPVPVTDKASARVAAATEKLADAATKTAEKD